MYEILQYKHKIPKILKNLKSYLVEFAYLVNQWGVTVLKCEQSERAGLSEGLVQGPWFPVHQSKRWVGHMMLCQVWGGRDPLFIVTNIDRRSWHDFLKAYKLK